AGGGGASGRGGRSGTRAGTRSTTRTGTTAPTRGSGSSSRCCARPASPCSPWSRRKSWPSVSTCAPHGRPNHPRPTRSGPVPSQGGGLGAERGILQALRPQKSFTPGGVRVIQTREGRLMLHQAKGASNMKIVVIGGTGLIGSKVVARLTERGNEAIAASPRSGVNALTGEGLAEALDGASVVVDVSNSPSFEDQPALE